MSSVADMRVAGSSRAQAVQITAQDCRETLADDLAGGRAGERLEALTAGVPTLLIVYHGIRDNGESAVSPVCDNSLFVGVLVHILPRRLCGSVWFGVTEILT